MIDAVLHHDDEPRDAAAAAVASARGGDEALIRRHWPAVRRYLRVLGADAAAADDLAQDVFVLALQKRVVDRGGRTLAWLRRAARLRFLEVRRERRGVAIDEAELVWQEQERDGDARRQALRQCLQLLTERSQQAVRLAYGERRSWQQIAAALGIRASGVKTLLRRCRAALRECIERSTKNGEEVAR